MWLAQGEPCSTVRAGLIALRQREPRRAVLPPSISPRHCEPRSTVLPPSIRVPKAEPWASRRAPRKAAAFELSRVGARRAIGEGARLGPRRCAAPNCGRSRPAPTGAPPGSSGESVSVQGAPARSSAPARAPPLITVTPFWTLTCRPGPQNRVRAPSVTLRPTETRPSPSSPARSIGVLLPWVLVASRFARG